MIRHMYRYLDVHETHVSVRTLGVALCVVAPVNTICRQHLAPETTLVYQYNLFQAYIDKKLQAIYLQINILFA